MNNVLPPEKTVPAVETPARRQIEENLQRFARVAAGALSDNTARALKADTAIFTGWCAEQGREPLPASPETVTLFIDMMTLSRKPATVRRYVSSIARLHKAAESPGTNDGGCPRGTGRLIAAGTCLTNTRNVDPRSWIITVSCRSQ